MFPPPRTRKFLPDTCSAHPAVYPLKAMKFARPSLIVGWTTAALLLAHLASFAVAGQKDTPPAAQLPAEIQNAKIYKFPEKNEPGVPVESPVIYRTIAYDDIKSDRLLLNLFISIKPADRSATVKKIYFQNVRVGGIPVHIDTFESEFKVSKKDVVDLPAPLKCTIVFSDLDSLAPLSQLVENQKVLVTGDSFIEVKLNALQKLALGGKQVVLPVKLNDEIPFQFLPDSPFLQMAAKKVLDTLSDPQTAAAIQLAKDHLAKLTAENGLSSLGKNGLYLVYCEYALRDPKSEATEKFVQSGTGFVVSEDGKLLTAKRVIQPWKFDPQVAFLMKQFHLELDEASYKISAWPAGAQVLSSDGQFNFQAALTTDQHTLKVLKTGPDEMKTQDYHDVESGTDATIELDAPGVGDAAVLQLSGTGFQPLALADPPAAADGGDVKTAMLSFPYGLSQPLAVPQVSFVKATPSGPSIVLDQPMNTGESGAPLVTVDGKVLAMAGSGKDCIPISAIRSLIQ
jgi:Trypsin-like peptidase domain